MRNLVLFAVCLAAGAAVAALAVGPAPHNGKDGPGDDAVAPFSFFDDAEAPERESVARVEAEGVVRGTVRACALPRSCQVDVGAPAAYVEVVRRPGLARLDLSVEWTPASAGSSELVAELLACGEPCSQTAPVLASIAGTSPLPLTYAPLASDALEAYTIRVRLWDAVPGPPEAYASLADQAFLVLGSATYR